MRVYDFFGKVYLGDDCWEWKGCKDPKGYGRFKYQGKVQRAHRVAYLWFKGRIEPGMCVCHCCDNPSCVRPDHLWLGSPLQNVQDRDLKRRTYKKLTENEINAMRTIYEGMKVSQRKIAEGFGVSQMQVSRIVRGFRSGTHPVTKY